MIARVIEFSIKRRNLVVFVVFGVCIWGLYCSYRLPVDAIPDLSENQVMVWTDWAGRSPKDVEDQITYPLSVSLQGLAGVKVVRGSSEFGFSMITVIFEDDVDFYSARQRVIEKFATTSELLPAGVSPYLGTDSTALGQVFWYTVEGGDKSLDELRAIQDWYVRYQLYVPGVAEVASIGGFVREYQVDVDPRKLRAFDVSLGEVADAVMRSNSSIGGKVMQSGGSEYLISAVGWIRGLEDLRSVVVTERRGVPITVEQVGTVQLGPAFRRGLLEKEGREAVGGVVVMRQGENPLSVIQQIKAKIQALQGGLPPGVRIVPFYDRTGLIMASIGTLTRTLVEEIVIASLVVLLILRHFRSALVICSTLPIAVLISFIFMYYLRIPSNIMSLSGILISIGVLVDAAVVITENAYNRLQAQFKDGCVTGDTQEAVLGACTVVGGPLFFAIVIMLLSFAPLFFLGGIEGKMFVPLASTKSFALVGVALLAITLVPALIPTFVRGRLKSQREVWLVRSVADVYERMLEVFFKRPDLIVVITGLLLLIGLPLFPRKMPWTIFIVGAPFIVGTSTLLLARRKALCLAIFGFTAFVSFLVITPGGEEFMPPLDEQSLLDMPVTRPSVNITQGASDIKERNAILRGFPEAHQVVGKLGRAETPTDPAPLDMVETVMTLHPKEWWPRRKVNFQDVVDEVRATVQALSGLGVLLPMGDSERETLEGAVAAPAAARFDRLLRAICAEDAQEFSPVLRRELVQCLRQSVCSFLTRKGALKGEQPEADWASVDAELQRDCDRRFDEWILLEDVTRLAQKVVTLLISASAIELPSDIWAREESIFSLVGSVTSVVTGRTEPSVFEDIRHTLERRRNDLMVARVKQLDWKLLDRAPRALIESAVDEAVAAARAAKQLRREPEEGEIRSIEAARERALGASLLLWKKLKSDIVKELDADLQVPGWSNIWTQPIINRIDMLSTGVRTEIGVKVFGKDIHALMAASNDIAEILKSVPGAADVTAAQISGKSYMQVSVDRKKAARYGLNVEDVQAVVEAALGGKHETMTVEGRERFPVRVGYSRDFLEDEEKLKMILVASKKDSMRPDEPGSMMSPGTRSPPSAPAASGAGGHTETTAAVPVGPRSIPDGKAVYAAPLSSGMSVRPEASPRRVQLPLSMVADVNTVIGPTMIQSENGLLRTFVSLNVRGRDIVGFVEEAQRAVDDRVKLPPGCHIEWSGQFEQQVSAQRTLTLLLPLVLCIIFVILYLTYRDLPDTIMMFLAVPGTMAGGVMFQYVLPKLGVDVSGNFSVAVWVGYIACFGLATATSIVMLVYLREAIEKRGGMENIRTEEEIKAAVIEGAVHRLRPKLLTEATTLLALIPMLWATGVGSEYMRPMAAPILGGILVADEVIDAFIPVLFHWDRCRRLRKRLARPGAR